MATTPPPLLVRYEVYDLETDNVVAVVYANPVIGPTTPVINGYYVTVGTTVLRLKEGWGVR